MIGYDGDRVMTAVLPLPNVDEHQNLPNTANIRNRQLVVHI